MNDKQFSLQIEAFLLERTCANESLNPVPPEIQLPPKTSYNHPNAAQIAEPLQNAAN